MFVDQILYPVNTLGPGNRIGIWLSGCNKRCTNCANPELWVQKESQKISVRQMKSLLMHLMNKHPDGITISGGEPMLQSSELCELIDSLDFEGDILVFTGYKKEEINNTDLLNRIDVLIDGEYIDDLNDNRSALIGSTNQQIHYLNKKVIEKYQTYIEGGRQIQNFIYDYRTVSVGIHNRSGGENGKT